MRIYLAAPFFTPAQVLTVQTIEDMLRTMPDIELYSPRLDGIILKDLPPGERLLQCHKVFITNIERINWCDTVLAVIDDRDPGTIFEIGYGYAKQKRIVTYTAQDYGLNVMLQCCVVAHVRNLPDLAYLFQHGVSDDHCAQFRNFHSEVT